MTRLLRERILSRVAKESKQEQVSKTEWAFKSTMWKGTISKAREISIEHLREVPGSLLAAYKNLLQTCQRAADIDARGDDDGVLDSQFLAAQVHFNSSLEDVDRKFTFFYLDFVHRAADTERVGDQLDARHVVSIVREVIVRNTTTKQGSQSRLDC